MAYGLKYTIPFVDVSGNAFEVRISQEGYTGEAMVLDGAPSPFVSRLDDSDDLMTPIRTSTAQISFVDDIDISDIMPQYDNEVLVQLYDISASTERWRGFVNCEVYSQPYIASPNIITINATSTLEVALSRTVKFTWSDLLVGHKAFATVLSECVNEVISQSYQSSISYPMSYVTLDRLTSVGYYQTDFQRPLSFRFPIAKYMELAKENNDEYTNDTCRTIFEDFCKLFGWTLTDINGIDFLLVDNSIALNARYIGYGLSQNGLDESRFFSFNRRTVHYADYIDDDSATIDYIPPVKELTIEVSAKNGEVKMPDAFDCAKLTEILDTINKEGQVKIDGDSRYFYVVYADIADYEYNKGMAKPLLSSKIGYKRIRWRTGYSNSGDRADFQPAMYSTAEWVNCIVFDDNNVVRDVPMFELRGYMGMVGSGRFTLNVEFCVTDNYLEYYSTDGKKTIPGFPGKDTGTGNFSFQNRKLRFSLQVGDKYYNSSTRAWDNSAHICQYDTSEQASQWHKCESSTLGTIIPINILGLSNFEKIGGEIVLTLYSAHINQNVSPFYLIRNIELRYEPAGTALSDMQAEENARQYSIINNGISARETSLNLHTKIENFDSTGEILYYDSESLKYYPVDTLYRRDAPTSSIDRIKLEKLLFDNQKLIFQNPYRRISAGINITILKPESVIIADGYVCALTGYEVDWAEHHVDVKLSQVAKFAPMTAIMEDTANETNG